MIFNTWTFALYLALVLPLYWVLPARVRPYGLIVFGCIFYAFSYPPYLIMILGLSTLTYAAAVGLLAYREHDKARMRKLLMFAGVIIIAGTLVYFKYTPFIMANVPRALFHFDPTKFSSILVPLAISFFTFEFVHFLVDVNNGKIKDINVRDFAVFAMFFPTLVAGPIKRYQNFAPQIDQIEFPTPMMWSANIYRILLGLAKKSIIADSMTPLTQSLLTPGFPYSSADYWIGALAYTVKIYFDFTGYSDIAIGIGGLLGFDILENFDRPYRSANIQVFWRRWHMSLSSWIRDYIFIPLGGSKRGAAYTIMNLSIVMVIAGFWHGAAWHFAAWGLWHGAGLAIHRAYSLTPYPARLATKNVPATKLASIALTFLFCVFGWVLFCCPSIGAAATVMSGMLNPVR